MEAGKIQQQSPLLQQAEQDIWSSAFDEKEGTQSAPPPPLKIKASSVGRPLSESVRRTYEQSLGIDLGEVRIHDDSAAKEAAKLAGAEAFTEGMNIYFGAQGFVEGDPKCERLLAHELQHVKQHKQGRVPDSREQAVSNPDDALEQEAYAAERDTARNALKERGGDDQAPELSGVSTAPVVSNPSGGNAVEGGSKENAGSERSVGAGETDGRGASNDQKDSSESPENGQDLEVSNDHSGAASPQSESGADGDSVEKVANEPIANEPATASAVNGAESGKTPLISSGLPEEGSALEGSSGEMQAGDPVAMQSEVSSGLGGSSVGSIGGLNSGSGNAGIAGLHTEAQSAFAGLQGHGLALRQSIALAVMTVRAQVAGAYGQERESLTAAMTAEVQLIEAKKATEVSSLQAFLQGEAARYLAGKEAQRAALQESLAQRKQAALELGESEAMRALAESEADANQAYALAGSFATSGDADLSLAKQRALNAIARDAALKIRRNGKEVAARVRQLAAAFVTEVDKAYAEFLVKMDAETADQAAAAQELEAKVVARIESAAQQAIGAVTSACDQGIAALNREEADALTALEQQVATVFERVDEWTQQLAEVYQEDFASALMELEEAAMSGGGSEAAMSGSGSEAAMSGGGSETDLSDTSQEAPESVESHVSSESGGENGLDAALAGIRSELNAFVSSTMAAMDGFGMDALSKLKAFGQEEAGRSAGIGAALRKEIGSAGTQVTAAFATITADVRAKATTATDELLAAHSEACNSMTAEIDRQFATGQQQLGTLVNDGLQGGRNLLQDVGPSMSGALQEIESEYGRLKTEEQASKSVQRRILRSIGSFFSGIFEGVGGWLKRNLGDVLGGILSGIFQAAVITMVGCFAIGAVIVGLMAAGVSAAAAVMIGIVVGVVAGVAFGIYNRFSDYAQDHGHGPSFWEGVGLTVLGILDMTGIPLIVEGIVGRRAFGREMDNFERAERVGMGVFSLVAMLASVVKGVRGMRGGKGAGAKQTSQPNSSPKAQPAKLPKHKYIPGKSKAAQIARRAAKRDAKKAQPKPERKVGKRQKRKEAWKRPKPARRINLDDPTSLCWMTLEQIRAALLEMGFVEGVYEGNSKAVKMYMDTPNGRITVIANNGGGRHSGGGNTYKIPYYYKVQAPNKPKIKVIDPDRYSFEEYQNMKDWRIIDGNTKTVLKPEGITLTVDPYKK